MPTELAYWDIRGLAQPIRFLLKYVGEDFVDKRYVCGPGPDYDRSEWLKAKFALGLDFPNLPYYMDGDIKITQTNAILQHLARKHNLYGSTDKDKAHSDMLLNVTMDVRNGLVMLAYGKPYSEEAKRKYLTEVKDKFAPLSTYLGEKKFFLGDQLTVSDFHIYEMIDQHQMLQQDLLSTMPNLEAFADRFRQVPAIKAYLSSDSFKAKPCNNKMANF